MRPGLILAGWLAVSTFMSVPGWAYPQGSQRQKILTAAEEKGDGGDKEDSDGIENVNDEKTETSTAIKGNWKGLGERFLTDQKQVWTSPAKLRWPDVNWLLPLSGVTAGLFVTDADMSRHISHNPTTVSHYNTASNAGLAALLGGAGAMWLFSYPKHNEHWRETGFLAGEAVLNSLVVVEAMKYPLGRERPYQGNGNGNFFSGGTSFPSEHAAAAWAVASVVAHEYPGPLTKILAYGLATFVDYSRYRARQHFPSDVFVGSIIGNMVAEDIYNRHHDPELGGEAWNSLRSYLGQRQGLSRGNMGSPYVPLDSWIYPAFDRLAALGVIDSGFAGMRPWTRMECVRLLDEGAERMASGAGGLEGEKTYRFLETEFREDLETVSSGKNSSARVESVYSTVTGISGEPLTDGNHFGQTIVNDFGRPYQEGFSAVTGFSGWAANGHLIAYIRAEYQHAPSAPAQSLAVRQFIGSSDGLSIVPPATPYAQINSVELLDAYFGLNFENWQLTFGRQSLWWSPVQSGPLMFSDNAEPVNMFLINRVSPFKLPWIFGWLGPMRFELFVGQMAGHQFVDDNQAGLVGQYGLPLSRQPMLHGEKLSFKPTQNFEFSVSETTVYGGGPTPFTWHTFFKSYGGFIVPVANTPETVDITDPRSGIDFSYRVPGLRRWLTFYGDAFTEDEYSPLGYPRKSAFHGGLYLVRIPGIPKLDLRLEGGTTAPVDFLGCNGCFYDNARYPDGSYVNKGTLVGSWLGRGAEGQVAWSTYHFSPRSWIQFQYRHQKVDAGYLPRGGTLNDGGVQLNLQVKPDVTFSGLLQYEKWNYPLLAPTPQSNWTTSLGITFWPQSWSIRDK